MRPFLYHANSGVNIAASPIKEEIDFIFCLRFLTVVLPSGTSGAIVSLLIIDLQIIFWLLMR